VDVVVTKPGSSATSTGGFTYYEEPTITGGGIAPHVGPVTGGTRVTISGTNFTGTTSVTFGGTAANLAACSVSTTTITCSTPAHAAGVVDVIVTTPGGSATSTGGFTYLYIYYFPIVLKPGASH
jgi:large repetitive protein